MRTAVVRVQDHDGLSPRRGAGIDDPPSQDPEGMEKPMSASAAAHEHRSNSDGGRHLWRNLVFGVIGLLYLTSLFVPELRQALARVFTLYPQ